MINKLELRLGNIIRYAQELTPMDILGPNAGKPAIGMKPIKPIDMVVEIGSRYLQLANTVSGASGEQYKDYEGVPITADHLVKMGFKHLSTEMFNSESRETFWIGSDKPLEGFKVCFVDSWYKLLSTTKEKPYTKENPYSVIAATYENNYVKTVVNVHDLQNAYYLSTGEELIFENWRQTWEQFFGYGFFPPKK